MYKIPPVGEVIMYKIPPVGEGSIASSRPYLFTCISLLKIINILSEVIY